MNIFSAQSCPDTAPHPTWCQLDLPTDAGDVVHVSEDRSVTADAGGPAEVGFVSVSVEQHGDGAPVIRIEGSGDPMTPLAAFELASTLQAAAISALMGGVR